jgi:hypothetical protein
MQDNRLEHLKRLDHLLATVLDLPPDQRRAFLESGNEEDTLLRTEALVLLENDAGIDRFLDGHSATGDTSDEEPTFVAGLSPAEDRREADPYQLTGNVISNYHIIEVIGRGGMGIVYKGKDVRLDRHVAL